MTNRGMTDLAANDGVREYPAFWMTGLIVLALPGDGMADHLPALTI